MSFASPYSAEKTARKGYSGVVAGVFRGAIAERMSFWFRGIRVHKDTISRYLERLHEILGHSRCKEDGDEGHCACLLQWHQPSPEEAERHDLPRAVQYLEDGRQLNQACNVYWFVSPEWYAKNAAPHLRLVGTFRADPAAVYSQSKEIRTESAGGPSDRKEPAALRAPPEEGSGALRAPHNGDQPRKGDDRGGPNGRR